MQAAETVYEFGSSPDEDDDNNDQTASKNDGQNSQNKSSKSTSKASSSSSASTTKHLSQQQQQPNSISGTNQRANKNSSSSINQKLNTSFGSISDSHATNLPNNNNPPPLTTNSSSQQINRQHQILPSEEQLLLKAEGNLNNTTTTSTGGSSSNLVSGSVGNVSNTSLSSATNSSRGNISQSGNQSLSASSQKSVAHHQSSSSQQQQNPNFDSNVISERVKNLATQIYQELKRIISRCNYDEDILSGLMPLIVRVLESLDLALIENQQLQVELELCKDDNDQLVVMFEKEKAAKRAIDKKLIESEYAYEEERQQYQQKIESLDNTVKMYELKAKNASDQATRFEEKEAERKREYKKLHDRYTELLKSHCDVVERVRHLAGSNEAANLSNLNVPHQMVATSSEMTISELQSHQLNRLKSKSDDPDFTEKAGGLIGRTRDTLKSWNTDTELTLEDASLVVIDDMVGGESQAGKVGDGSSHNESERATSEPDGEHEKDSENDSIAYTSMEKEFRKLIQENKDLLNTKNALNVVKDDLIAEVDRLTNEVSMYEQAVEQLNSTKDQMKQKVSVLDTELRKTKEELEKAKQKIRENNEEGVPYSQRKRFGRAEMAKVLMERNNYKERFMELQDAVRYTEIVRANKVETEKRSGLWKFFSNLFGAPPVTRAILDSPRNSSPVISYTSAQATATAALTPSEQQAAGFGGVSNQLVATDALQSSIAGRVSTASIRSTSQRLTSNSDMIVLMDSDLNVDRSRASREVGGRLSSDATGYIHAYGWSLRAPLLKAGGGGSPVDSLHSSIAGCTSSYVSPNDPTLGAQQADVNVSFNNSKLAGLQVPIPQYCRPLTGDSLGMKIWCATAIDMSGEDIVKDNEHAQQTDSQDNTANTELVNITGSSVASSAVNISTSTPIKSTSGRQSLKQLEREVSEALGETIDASTSPSRRPVLKTTTEMVLNALPCNDDAEELSTCVWICSTQHSRSKITIIDIKTKPNELLDSFYVPTFLYCIRSVPGFKSSDLLGLPSNTCDGSGENREPTKQKSMTLTMIDELISTQKKEFYKLIKVDSKAYQKLRRDRIESKRLLADEQNSTGEVFKQSIAKPTSLEGRNSSTKSNEDDAEISRILDNNVSASISTLQKLNEFVAHTQPQLDDELPREQRLSDSRRSLSTNDNNQLDPNSCKDAVYYQPISTHLSTVWMGGKDSVLYVHSAIGQWKDCVACVELCDSILQICHHRGRVFVALANGSLCVFFRDSDTKQWDFTRYLLIDTNLLTEVTADNVDLHNESGAPADMHSLFVSQSKTEKGCLDNTETGKAIEPALEASVSTSTQHSPSHQSSRPRRSKVAGIHCLEIANRNLWVACRNRVLIFDPITLKLKHTFNVVPQADNQIRQLVCMKDGVFICLRSDLTLRLFSSLRPYQHIQNIDIEPIVTRLISPKTFVISHITALKVAENTLWIGIAHGIILTIPCKLTPQISEAPLRNNRTGEFEESPSHLAIARFVPKCDIANAQISFHGHRDAVKFFVRANNLMLSGGQGYLDFRLDMDDQSKAISDKSHLILWQLPG